jgi:hypothetical protein
MKKTRRQPSHLARRIVIACLVMGLGLSITFIPMASSATRSARPLPRLKATVNDLGFKPKPNGFSFENYGSDEEPQNLTTDIVRALFGDAACTIKSGGKLVLSPPAKQWMDEVNKDMANGHCEGMAALSLLFFTGQEDTSDYGGANAYSLKFEDNTDLQSEIARWYATQALDPTETSVLKGTPAEIVATLAKDMSAKGETYTIGIYKADGTEGHAITPYSVVDDGGGKYRIMVYDNNYPGEERAVSVDANANTWSYESAVNPKAKSDLYTGDAKTRTLELTPTSSRVEQQSAPFAISDGGPAYASLGIFAPPPSRFNQFFLQGQGKMVISDLKGRQLGYVNGNIVNDIPGARYTRLKEQTAGSASASLLYWLPEKTDVSATIEGTSTNSKSPTDLTVIGPGFAAGVSGIATQPGQKDTVLFDPTDQGISYETDRTESPDFLIAVDEQNNVGYNFDIKGMKMEGGGTITAVLDTKEQDLLINTEKLKKTGVFSLVMTRIDSKTEDEITADDLKLPAGALIYVHYGDWKGTGSAVQMGVDLNGDGTIDDVYEATPSRATTKVDGISAWVWVIIAAAIALAALLAFFLMVWRRPKEPGDETAE